MNRPKSILRLVTWLLLLLVLPVLWLNANAIIDWAKLYNYQAPQDVSTLAVQDTMTSYAKHLFYVNRPKIDTDAAVFRTQCPESEQTIVLGCYKNGQNGIGIYSVKDPRLNGVVQVTAAHEMLHSAYERLGSKDRQNIDDLLTNYFNTQVKDQRLIDTINAYKVTEPNDIPNEMHSIFGTEVSSLPAPLENYYKKYFSNRAVVVAYASTYQSEFTSRLNSINSYDAQLKDLKDKIASEENILNQQLDQINSDRARLESLRSNDQISEYNAAVPSFNLEVSRYNSGVSTLKADISRYNTIVNTRNAVAEELRGLDSSIDTRLTTQTSP